MLSALTAGQVGDFGLSRLCGPEGYVSTAECGTVPYMAGEYLDNRLMKSSDVYSFGVLLWQMYTGRAPFAGHHEGERGRAAGGGAAMGRQHSSLHCPSGLSVPPPTHFEQASSLLAPSLQPKLRLA